VKKKRYAVKRKPTASLMVLLGKDAKNRYGRTRQVFRARGMSARRHAEHELGIPWVQPRHR